MLLPRFTYSHDFLQDVTDQQQVKHMRYPQSEITGQHLCGWKAVRQLEAIWGENRNMLTSLAQIQPGFKAPLRRNDFHHPLQMLSK